jgi:hypothetical protein
LGGRSAGHTNQRIDICFLSFSCRFDQHHEAEILDISSIQKVSNRSVIGLPDVVQVFSPRNKGGSLTKSFRQEFNIFYCVSAGFALAYLSLALIYRKLGDRASRWWVPTHSREE